MNAKGFVVPPDGGSILNTGPGRSEAGSIVGAEANEIRRRHGWEIIGPPPF